MAKQHKTLTLAIQHMAKNPFGLQAYLRPSDSPDAVYVPVGGVEGQGGLMRVSPDHDDLDAPRQHMRTWHEAVPVQSLVGEWTTVTHGEAFNNE